MWREIERRIEENETDKGLPAAPLRRSFFEELQQLNLEPTHTVKKMSALRLPNGQLLLWEITSPAQNFFVTAPMEEVLREAGFSVEDRVFDDARPPHGGRHSALSSDWAFGREDCYCVKIESAEEIRRMIAALGNEVRLKLRPEAIDRWIARLRDFFPGLDRFDQPDPDFDARERDYKLKTARELRDGLEQAGTDQEIADTVHSALANSNLLPWRAYWPMSPKGDAERSILLPALAELVSATSGDASGYPKALEAFSDAWARAVPDGKPDPARQIAEFLFIHLNPEAGIYIRHTVREDFWKEAVGSRFPECPSMADMYRQELRFMTAVKRAFEERGLAPRDMIDVQSALWVVHNYKDENRATTGLQDLLSREAVEEAMDAFDNWQASQAHDEIFGQFGNPKDYWVRSTKDRAAKVYPTKPIVGFVLGKTSLNGGWGQKTDAAARLHNAGFIIVDQDDKPVVPPKQYDHLIRNAEQAEYVRICALNYHIAPAREREDTRVSIRAGDLASDLHLSDRLRNVCQSLKGRKFQDLAEVPPPAQSGVDDSSTTIFTYSLGSNMQAETVTDTPQEKQNSATNLILYGPPGTGKTYETAWEAVRLCLGEEAAKALQGPEHRSNLMGEYRQLVSDGRVAFVTFHQSMSYEEFVEGLRPETQSEEGQEIPGDSIDNGGFRLKVEEGVFKRFSERARLDKGDAEGAQTLDRSSRVFKVALGRRHVEDDRIRYGLGNDLIHLGWGEDIDWSDQRFDEFNEIFSEWRARKNPEASGHDGNIVCTFSFRSDMQVGDYVVVSDGRDRIQAVGRVTGEYFFDSDAEFHPHRRQVQWLWRDDDGEERDRFYPNGFRRHSVYKLNQSLVDWDALNEIVFGEEGTRSSELARDHVLIIDEINRANISKVFGELITLLEPDKRIGQPNEIRPLLPYSKKRFGVPSNLHIIGTMNTADRSIALLDTALRRRFRFRELMPDASVLPNDVDGIDLRKLLTSLNERIEYLFDREHQIGHAYFIGCQSLADVDAVMRDSVIPLLAEYFYEDWSKIAMVLEGRPAPEEGDFDGYFLRGRRLVPNGFDGDADGVLARTRWSVKEAFDFREYATS
jgi:hypothetical protein